MKNALEGIKSRLENVKEWISNLEDRIVEIIQSKQQKEQRILKNEDSLRDPWDNIKHTIIGIIGVLEGEEREKGTENLSEEIMAENFHNLVKETGMQVQEAQEEFQRWIQRGPHKDTI